jgi:transposase
VKWLRFLKQIERETPPELQIHLIADNCSAHKHPKVKEWLKRHPRFVMHFTPTSSSWLNLVERFFAELSGEVIREGSFRSIKRIQHPKPYRWHAKRHEILAKIERARKAAATAANSL